MESVFKSDKNQLAPVEEVAVYVPSPPRTKSLPSRSENRDFHINAHLHFGSTHMKVVGGTVYACLALCI